MTPESPAISADTLDNSFLEIQGRFLAQDETAETFWDGNGGVTLYVHRASIGKVAQINTEGDQVELTNLGKMYLSTSTGDIANFAEQLRWIVDELLGEVAVDQDIERVLTDIFHKTLEETKDSPSA